MKPRFVIIAVFALLTLACERVVQKTPEYRPEEAGTVDHALCLLGFTAIPLRELLSGHHLVNATLNGKEATFVLDTGANVSVVDSGTADEFRLSGGTAVPGITMGLGGAMRAAGCNSINDDW